VSEGKAAPAAAAGQGAERGSRNLLIRIAAAVVLAPLAIAAAYAGDWWWIALVTPAAIGLFVEWLTVVGSARETGAIAAGVTALAIAGLCLGFARVELALAVLALGVAVTALLSSRQRGWTAAGFLYAGAAQIASVLVRLDAAAGFVALVFVMLIVWVTDIGGYFAGRGIGGPKLWPRVSPNKTWAGAIGGFGASLVVALGFAALDLGKAYPMVGLAAMLSVVAQLGDLFESAVKRRFGVKDSSHIIPGHGGLMDRLDGYVAAIAVAAIFGLLRGGVDGVGRGLMVW
jgi:phosphatidate cytidylyltransferase